MLMEEILENYKTLWLKSVQDKKASYRNKDNNNTKTAATSEPQPQPPCEPTSPVGSHKYITFNRMRLLEDSLSDIEAYLWDQFERSVENLYYLHLRLAEHCLNTRFPDVNLKDSSVLFLNKTFENWMRKALTTTAAAAAVARQQTNDEKQKYALEVYHILKAFDLACINMNLLTSFNKIYKFDQNVNTLRIKLDELARRAAGGELVKIVSELKVNEQYPIDYESIIIPLMISDKYKQVDELIGTNERTLLDVVGVCDKLCAEYLNFKKLADKYEGLKKSNKFTGKQVANYGLSCLKRAKKAHLIRSAYLGIQFQLSLSQLRFFIQSAYSSTEPMSFDAWSELVIDLLGTDERLINQLFYEIVHFKRDVNLAVYFVKRYGYEYMRRLPSATQSFYDENAVILDRNGKYMENILLKWPPPEADDFYYPSDLRDGDIVDVSNQEQFNEMLKFFETNKPEIIGLDSEWKPTFGPEDTDMTDANTVASINANGDKNQRAHLFQIATRTRTFLVEVRDLVDRLSTASLDRFGALVLFNDDIIKLGFNFDQDSHRLSHCFWKFNHRFCEFTQSVVNMDEAASDLDRRYNILDKTAVASKATCKSSESNNRRAKNNKNATAVAAAAAVEVEESESATTIEDDDSGKTVKSGGGGSKSKSLNTLTLMCLGKPLDKRERMSNWLKKPLRPAQRRYAALDAFVLIKIHDVLVDKLKQLGAPDVDYIATRQKRLI